MSWLGRPADAFLSIGLSLLYLASASLPGVSLPPPPQGPGAGGEARPGEGWPCLGGLPRYPPRRRCLAADPGARIWVICGPLSQWESVAPALSLFLGLQTLPRHCGRHLEPRGRRGLWLCRHAGRTRPPPPPRPAPRDAPLGPSPRARLPRSLSHAPRPSGPAESQNPNAELTRLWGFPDNSGWGRQPPTPASMARRPPLGEQPPDYTPAAAPAAPQVSGGEAGKGRLGPRVCHSGQCKVPCVTACLGKGCVCVSSASESVCSFTSLYLRTGVYICILLSENRSLPSSVCIG